MHVQVLAWLKELRRSGSWTSLPCRSPAIHKGDGVNFLELDWLLCRSYHHAPLTRDTMRMAI